MMEPQNRVRYRIGRRAGKHGPCPTVGNQAEFEKSAAGTDSSIQAHEDHGTEEHTHRALILQYLKLIKDQHEQNGSKRSKKM